MMEGPDAMPHVLLVEDNENDVELTRLGFERAQMHVTLDRAKDGEEGIAFLRKEGPYASAPTPDLVLLDLNMPRMDGREMLAEIAADATLRHFPVVILTTSSADREILNMYRLRCSSYVVKPMTFEEFAQAMQSIAEYWFKTVTLPHGQPS
jgi:two-component system, chemotaxis family, response regulator Rcp1